nr:MAG: hypothetical protein [Guangxi noda-like virus]
MQTFLMPLLSVKTIFTGARVVYRHPWSIAAIGGSALIAGWYYRKFVKSRVYEGRRWTLGESINEFLLDRTRVVSVENLMYMTNDIQLLSRNTNNGHAIAGSARDTAVKIIDEVISRAGLQRWDISSSRHVRSVGGVVEHVVPHDLYAGRDFTPMKDDSVVVGIDVDYYLESFEPFMEKFRPMAFYTFVPETVSGTDGENPFTINDGRINFSVSGGATWNHQIWEWAVNNDYLGWKIRRSWFQCFMAIFGVCRVYAYKKIHVKPFQEHRHRRIVWLVPEVKFWTINWLPSRFRWEELKRCKFQMSLRPEWNCITRNSPEGTVMSIGPNNEEMQMEILRKNYDLLMHVPSATSLASRMLQMEYKSLEIAIFTQHYNGVSRQHTGEFLRFGEPAVAKPFAYVPYNLVGDPEETTWRALSPAMVNSPNGVPLIKRMEAVCQSIEHRVTFHLNEKVPGERVQQYARDFVEMVVIHAGQAHPYSVEETAGFLDKPTQVAAIQRIWDTLDANIKNQIECFIKNEPTMKPNRIISGFADARFLLQLSQFTLKMRDDILHNLDWFMPGRKPGEIAQAVQDYCLGVKRPVEGDYSNFDGTVSAWLQRNVINACYLRYFRQEYKSELNKMLDVLVSCPAKTKRFGLRYEAGPGIKSGSPTTCDGNSLLNGFLMYAALRRSMPHATSAECFGMIGLAFGDDSLFDSQFVDGWNSIVKEVGMKIKTEKYDPAIGVTFLARVYIDPINTLTTFQDPLRTMRKLNITSRVLTVPLADAAVDRVEGYLAIDRRTPIISNYCQAVLRTYGPLASSYEKRQARADRVSDRPYWLYENDSWPQDEADDDLMLTVFSARMGLAPEVVREYMAHIDGLASVLDIAPIQIPNDCLELPYVGAADPSGHVGEDVGNITNNAIIYENSRRSREPRAHDERKHREPGKVSRGRGGNLRGQRKNSTNVEVGARGQCSEDNPGGGAAICETTVQDCLGPAGEGGMRPPAKRNHHYFSRRGRARGGGRRMT